MGRFRIKISSWFLDSDFCNLKYSTNGFIWHAIKTCEKDIMNGWYCMVRLNIPFNEAKYWISKFNSIEDIRVYHKRQRSFSKEKNAYRKAELKKNEEFKKEIYKKYS